MWVSVNHCLSTAGILQNKEEKLKHKIEKKGGGEVMVDVNQELKLL